MSGRVYRNQDTRFFFAAVSAFWLAVVLLFIATSTGCGQSESESARAPSTDVEPTFFWSARGFNDGLPFPPRYGGVGVFEVNYFLFDILVEISYSRLPHGWTAKTITIAPPEFEGGPETVYTHIHTNNARAAVYGVTPPRDAQLPYHFTIVLRTEVISPDGKHRGRDVEIPIRFFFLSN